MDKKQVIGLGSVKVADKKEFFLFFCKKRDIIWLKPNYFVILWRK